MLNEVPPVLSIFTPVNKEEKIFPLLVERIEQSPSVITSDYEIHVLSLPMYYRIDVNYNVKTIKNVW